MASTRIFVASICLIAATLGWSTAMAQATRVQPSTPVAAGGTAWSSLTPAQRAALAPLERQWGSIDAVRQEKWIEIAGRFPTMPADRRTRIHARMTEWAKLTPSERGQARLRYQELRRLTPQERQARWNAYQALPSDRRRELAARAAPRREAAQSAARLPRDAADQARRQDRPRAGKDNIVPNPSYTASPRPVSPTLLRADRGASTSLITRPVTPPVHQQTGLPKIAVTPGFVDRSTLLPQRGPQGAAVQARGASAPTRRARP